MTRRRPHSIAGCWTLVPHLRTLEVDIPPDVPDSARVNRPLMGSSRARQRELRDARSLVLKCVISASVGFRPGFRCCCRRIPGADAALGGREHIVREGFVALGRHDGRSRPSGRVRRASAMSRCWEVGLRGGAPTIVGCGRGVWLHDECSV